MKFQVPQFIEMEDKIFGPLSFKEFIYLAGGAGLSYIIYKYLPFFIALLLIIPVLAFACALAFYKVNNRSFIEIVESAFMFFVKNKLYIWKREEKPIATKEVDTTFVSGVHVQIPILSSESKLKETNWNLDVKSGDEKAIKNSINDSLNIKV